MNSIFGIIGTTALFLLILSILVLVHEWGHFIVARLCGVHVEEFGLGFPPRVRGWKRGRMIYSLNWLPLGGFVRLKGEQGDDANDTDSFSAQPIYKRLIILCAGVFMNVVLAIFLLTIGFSIGMPQAGDSTDAVIQPSQSIQIVTVVSGSPAERAGVHLGDVIESIDGKPFSRITDIQNYIRANGATHHTLILRRGAQEISKEVTPQQLSGGSFAFGVGLTITGIVRYSLPIAFIKSFQTTWLIVTTIVVTLIAAVSHLAFDGFVGPVGIAAYTATAEQLGLAYLINLMAQLSLSLAVINVLPIPALDGGRALFALIEKVRGKRLRPALENAIHLIGFATLIILLLAVTVRDIQHLFSS